MKILVTYYSRTGTTATAAKELAERLGADLEEIQDQRNRSGVKGYLMAGREVMKKDLTEIVSPHLLPSAYDLVVVATPVWAWSMSSAARTYLSLFRDQLPRLAFLLTQGGANDQKVAEKMCELVARSATDCPSLWLTTKEVRSGAHLDKLDAFAKRLKD